METPTNKQIFDFILDSFNETELNALCIDYFPEASYEFGSGMRLREKVKELIDYCNWHGIQEQLLVALRQEREEKYHLVFAQPISPPPPSVDPNQQHNIQAASPPQPAPQTHTNAPADPPQVPVSPAASSFIHEKTGLEFVRIPAGTFLYGTDKKAVDLPEYWISKTPVTNQAYKKFIETNPSHDVPKMWLGGENNWDKSTRTFKPELAEHPVVIVNWYEAVTFCEWAGLQLPTEEQWEKAARGIDGRSYPWGHDAPTDALCNFGQNVGGTTPVGRYSPGGDSPYGCVDMCGNVWEWCLNKYGKPEDTGIDQSGDVRVLRGGAWLSAYEVLQVTHRLGDFVPDFCYRDIGFRPVLARLPES